MTTENKTVENGFSRREALASGGVVSSAMAAETGNGREEKH